MNIHPHNGLVLGEIPILDPKFTIGSTWQHEMHGCQKFVLTKVQRDRWGFIATIQNIETGKLYASVIEKLQPIQEDPQP